MYIHMYIYTYIYTRASPPWGSSQQNLGDTGRKEEGAAGIDRHVWPLPLRPLSPPGAVYVSA